MDLETNGLDPLAPDAAIVGVGLANSRGCVYLDARGAGPQWWAVLAHHLDAAGGVAFNAAFDWAWLTQVCGRWPRLVGCSLTAFRLTANEGHFGQNWTLETAQATVLRWPASNKGELAEALARHSLSKSEMSRLASLEPELFGRYCALDAQASYQLWTHLAEAARDPKAGTLWRWVIEDWPVSIRLIVEQQLAGLRVDTDKLSAYATQLDAAIVTTEATLRSHPRLKAHIEGLESRRAAEFFAPHVTVAREVPTLAEWTANPEAYPSRAEPSKSSPKWQRAEGFRPFREVRTERPRNVGKTPPKFNFESDHDVRWLLYSCVYRAELTQPPTNGRPGKCTVWLEDGNTVEVSTTDSGQFPVGKDILPALGEIGAGLSELNRLTKQRGYVQAYLAASAADGRMHLRFKPAGTLTGRLSGG